MPRRVVFLAGSPSPQACLKESSNDTSILLHHFLVPFQLFFRLSDPPNSPYASESIPAWRHVALPDAATAVIVQAATDGVRQSDPAVPIGCGPKPAHMLEDEEFLDHSFNVSESMAAAMHACACQHEQMLPQQPSHASLSTSSDSAIQSASYVLAREAVRSAELTTLLNRAVLQDLGSLPLPAVVQRLPYQAFTRTVLAGVVTISPPRTVCIRAKRPGQTDRSMDIVKITLGDDSGSSLVVTFWLTPPSLAGPTVAAEDSNGLRADLMRLRRGAVLLVFNVALSVYKDQVYGESLRPRAGCRGTSVENIPLTLEAKPHKSRNFAKLIRVRDWVARHVTPDTQNQFVGHIIADNMERDGPATRDVPVLESLPPDTQQDILQV